MNDDKGKLLDEMREYKDRPEQVEQRNFDQRLKRLKEMVEFNPPTFQTYPGLLITSFFLLAIGGLLILGSLCGVGTVIYSYANEGSVRDTPPQYVPSDGGPGPLGYSPANKTNNLITSILSGSGLIIGFFMIVTGELIKLFVDLQENADRHSAALSGIFHLLLMERKK